MQRRVRAVNTGMRGAPRTSYTTADAVKYLGHLNTVFNDQTRLMQELGPRHRLMDSRRASARTLQLGLNGISSFCPSQHKSDKFSRPAVLIVGDYAWSKRSKRFPFKRFLRRLARTMIVIVTSEFRTTCLCRFCGGGIQHPQKMDETAHKGTSHCPDKTCVAQGRFKNRDAVAACNTCTLFIYRFLLGGYLGGFSDGEARDAHGQPPVDVRLSMFQTFAAELPAPA